MELEETSSRVGGERVGIAMALSQGAMILLLLLFVGVTSQVSVPSFVHLPFNATDITTTLGSLKLDSLTFGTLLFGPDVDRSLRSSLADAEWGNLSREWPLPGIRNQDV